MRNEECGMWDVGCGMILQPTAPRDETIRSSNNHNVAPFLRFAISNEKIAMSFLPFEVLLSTENRYVSRDDT